MVKKKKVSFIDTKTLTDDEYNEKANVKVTNGTFSTKVKKQLQYKFCHILKQNFVMFPEYIYKSFDIFTKIIIATI